MDLADIGVTDDGAGMIHVRGKPVAQMLPCPYARHVTATGIPSAASSFTSG